MGFEPVAVPVQPRLGVAVCRPVTEMVLIPDADPVQVESTVMVGVEKLPLPPEGE